MTIPPPRPPDTARLLLAGAPRVLRPGGEPLPLGRRDAALLLWLALEGPTARARLATLIWPGGDAPGTRNALRQRLFQLRRQAGLDLVEGQETLALACGVSHDLEDADDLLGGAPSPVEGEYAGWLEAQRVRRRGRVRDAIAELADAAEAARDWPDALAHARELLALEPLSEAAHRRVVRLHYLRGDRAAALLAFDALERMLKDEVGARPDGETMALLAIIERAPASDGAVALVALVAIARPPRMVGRARALAALRGAVRERRHALVVGEGGLGKSRLLAEFAAVQGDVLTVGARPGDADLPFALFARLVRAGVAAGHAPDASLVPELARFVPELGVAAAARFESGRFDATAERFLLALPPRPIALDDLHFADAASVELLTRLLAVEALPPMVLVLRPADGAPALAALQEAAAEMARCQSIVLAPLAEAELAELVDSLDIAGLAGSALAAPLARHAGGNPQFVLETLRTLLAEGGVSRIGQTLAGGALPMPASVSAAIQRRLKRLSPPAIKLARVAAIAAGDFSARLAARVLGGDLLDLADPWTELQAAQVLSEQGFAHDLVFEAVRAGVPPAVARPLHAGVARVLEAEGGPAAAIARHWLAAGEIERAVAPLARAADHARAAARLHEAAALYQLLADTHRQRGDHPACFAALAEHVDMLYEVADAPALDAAIQRLEALAADDAERSVVADRRAMVALFRWDDEAAEQCARSALELALRAGRRDAELAARVTLAQALARKRQTDEAVIVAGAIQDWVAHSATAEQRGLYDECIALLALAQGRYREATRLFERLAEQAQARGEISRVQNALNHLMIALGNSGRFQQAAEAGERERALIVEFRLHGNGLVNNDLNLAHLYAQGGRYADALAALDRAENLSVVPQYTLDLRRGSVFNVLGQPVRARPLFERALGAAVNDAQRAMPALGLARVLHAMSMAADAKGGAVASTRVAELLEIADRALPSSAPALQRAYKCLAQAECQRGRERLAAADAAVALLAGSEALPLILAARSWRTLSLLECGDSAAAAAAAEAQLALGDEILPVMMPPMLPALTAVRALSAVGDERASRVLGRAADWLHATVAAHVPAVFRESFLYRVPAHRELLGLASSLPGNSATPLPR